MDEEQRATMITKSRPEEGGIFRIGSVAGIVGVLLGLCCMGLKRRRSTSLYGGLRTVGVRSPSHPTCVCRCAEG
jgi:hypothetical protein